MKDRDALRFIKDTITELRELNPNIVDWVRKSIELIEKYTDAALSSKQRNCDRFNSTLSAQLAFLNEVWLISVDESTMLERYKWGNWTDEMKARFVKWLYDYATEEGESDGSK